jgi:two-component system sensor histidine kinase DesK
MHRERTRRAQIPNRAILQVAQRSACNRILLDLHDHVGPVAVQVPMQLEKAVMHIREGDIEIAEVALERAARQTRQTSESVRKIVEHLGSERFEQELVKAVEMLENMGMKVEWMMASVPPPQSDYGYSTILLEAVANIMQHSRAEHVRIEVDGEGMRVEDDGKGMGDYSMGKGLVEMRARAADLGMTVEVGESLKLGGTKVELRRATWRG